MNKEEFPPHIHNLFRLAEKIDKELFSEGYLEFFSELSPIISSRGTQKILIK